MSGKATLAGACAFLLLLLVVSPAAAPQAQVPTWNVGDTWAMGVRDVDLAPILTLVMENMKQMFPGLTYTVAGNASYFVIYKVDGVEAQQYRVSVTAGLEMSMNMSYNVSYQGQQMSASMNTVAVGKINGTAYYTKNELALSRQDLTLDLDMNISASGMGQDVSGSIDMTGNLSAVYNPALDVFNFPISVGENWTAESDVTMTGSLSGKANINGVEQSVTLPLDNSMHISISASCPSTQDVKLADGTTSTCYKIVASSTEMSQLGPISFTGISYYSPDQRFIVAQELTFGNVMNSATLGSKGTVSSYTSGVAGAESGQALFNLSPMTEQEARSAIAAMALGGGINLVLVGLVVAIIVIVIAAIVVIKRRRSAEPQAYELSLGPSEQQF